MINQNNFYEGKFIDTSSWTKKDQFLSFFYQRMARQKYFNRYISQGNYKILDIGCGGGNELFSKKGMVCGIDISKKSIKNALKLYKEAKISDSTDIKYPNNTLDYVVSSDLLGHLIKIDKNKTISEINRVLKKDGISIHYIELDDKNLYSKFNKKYPKLYKKYFIDLDGHYGLESIDENIKYFIKNKFKIIKIIPMYKLTFDTDEYLKRYNNEYMQKSKIINFKIQLIKIIQKNRLIKFLVNLLGGIIYDLISLFLPNKYAGGLFIVVKKD
jgi:ubiquinone/menaquinone biosynthesis C-methylase UbiE